MKKILLTTAYGNCDYDYWKENSSKNTFFRFMWKRRTSFGLRFIKQNVPEVEILEFPSLKEFKKKLASKKYDIVGFSFYLNEVPKAIEMAKYARSVGVKTLWAGNYGALTPEMEKHFDKLFIGYSEQEIAKELGKNIEKITHPILVEYIGTPSGLQIASIGTLQTTRGCTLGCKFCQTPYFCNKLISIPLESLDAILRKYKEMGVGEILIFDENFGIQKSHADQVIGLFEKYKFNWYAMTRTDILKINLDNWTKRGLIGVLIGIESVSQKNLDYINKVSQQQEVFELLKELNRRNLWVTAFYMIGFEEDTKESIKKDMLKLKTFKLDQYQICVVTPLPHTPLFKDIEKKLGIWDNDYSHYDAKHLVWNHPHIKPNEITEVLEDCFKTVYTKENFFNSFRKFYRKYTKKYGNLEGIRYMYKGILNATISLYIKKQHQPKFYKI